MQTRTFVPPCADRDIPFGAACVLTRRSALSLLAAHATLLGAFCLALFCLATGWPA